MINKSLTLILCIWSSFFVYSQEEISMDEIAKDMSNPTLPMFNLSTFYDYQKMTGDLPKAGNQNINLIGVQPPLPFPMKNGKSLIIRPLFSFNFSAPVYGEDGFESAGGIHFGDVPFDILYAGTNKETGLMFGYGAIANIPIASSSALRGEWRLGPSLLLGSIKKLVLLLVVNNSFQLSGDHKQSVLGGQYVVAVPLGKGWQFVASPPYSYNWETQDLTLPIGGGPFRTVMMGKTPIKVGAQFNYYVSQADPFGPNLGVRLNITPNLRRPW